MQDRRYIKVVEPKLRKLPNVMECLAVCQVMQLNILLRRTAMVQNKSLHWKVHCSLIIMNAHSFFFFFKTFYFNYWNDRFGIFTVAFQSSVIVLSCFGYPHLFWLSGLCSVYHRNQQPCIWPGTVTSMAHKPTRSRQIPTCRSCGPH